MAGELKTARWDTAVDRSGKIASSSCLSLSLTGQTSHVGAQH